MVLRKNNSFLKRKYKKITPLLNTTPPLNTPTMHPSPPNSPATKNQDFSHRERTVFVSGLDYRSTEASIFEFFKKCGEIELLKVPKYKSTQKNTGYCHVTFYNKESWTEATKLSGSYFDNRYLDIQPVKGPQNLPKIVGIERISTKTVFVKNLPYSASKEEIKTFFLKSGLVEDVKMVFNSDGSFKGHCYISFLEFEGVRSALLLSGYPFNGRFLKVY